jgi:hypothetical protein
VPDHVGGEEYELRIVALRGCVPPVVRLRQVLKGLLRTHNFRCTSCRDVTPRPPDATPHAAPAAAGGPGAAGGPSGQVRAAEVIVDAGEPRP